MKIFFFFLESALECTDEIEVGDEFKSELLLAEISLNDRSKFSGKLTKKLKNIKIVN